MSGTVPLQRFVFGELVPDTGGRGPAGPSLAGLSDHQLRKLVAELHDELERSRTEGRVLAETAREEGMRFGVEQARGELQASLLSAADCVNDALDTIAEEIAARFETVVRDSASLAFAAGEHLAGQALDQAPLSAIEGALNSVLSEMHKLTDLEIEVHPLLVAPLEEVLQRNTTANRKLKLMIHPDERLALGDAQISWGQGGLKVDLASRRAALLEALGVVLPDESIAES